MRDFFYRPEKGYVGDVIPYYEDGIYYLYFLYASRKKYEEGTSWYLVTTRDFIHYKEYGEVLAHGTEEDQDLNAYTGSIYKNDGVYYLYYTVAESARRPRAMAAEEKKEPAKPEKFFL